jgi:hypothetical protein
MTKATRDKSRLHLVTPLTRLLIRAPEGPYSAAVLSGGNNAVIRHLSCSVLSDSVGELQLMFRCQPFENGGPRACQESLVASGQVDRRTGQGIRPI